MVFIVLVLLIYFSKIGLIKIVNFFMYMNMVLSSY